jgi:hypothetical protein
VKNQNTSNVKHFINKRKLKATYQGWYKEIQIRKSLRIKTEESKIVLAGVGQRKGL